MPAHSTDWNMWSAIATAVATASALLFSLISLGAPARAEKRQRQATTEEVLYASSESLKVFYQVDHLVRSPHWNEEGLKFLKVKADHWRLTLERLIDRPFLTDGAIFTGAGAISLLDIVSRIQTQEDLVQQDLDRQAFKSYGCSTVWFYCRSKALAEIASGKYVAMAVRNRGRRVQRHMRGAIQRFMDRLRRLPQDGPINFNSPDQEPDFE